MSRPGWATRGGLRRGWDEEEGWSEVGAGKGLPVVPSARWDTLRLPATIVPTDAP